MDKFASARTHLRTGGTPANHYLNIMKTRSLSRSVPRLVALALATVAPLWVAGCCAPAHVVSSAGDTAAGAIKGAGRTAASATRTAVKTAASAVGTAGKTVQSGVNAAGKAAKATVGAAADVVTAPFVIFKDTKSARTCRVPWRDGMTLAGALQEAKVNSELVAVKILRGNDGFNPDRSFVLKPGDIIELIAKDGVPALITAGAL